MSFVYLYNAVLRNDLKILEILDSGENVEGIDSILDDVQKRVIELTGDSDYFAFNSNSIEDQENYILLKSIIDNDNLEEKEKKIILGYYDFFKDYDFLDKKQIYKQFYNLKIYDHDSFKTRLYKIYKDILGGNLDKYIAVHENNSIYYLVSNPDKATIAHESAHNMLNSPKLPQIIIEGLAVLLEEEYISNDLKPLDELGSYNRSVAITKILCDLVGSDAMIKSLNDNSMDPIKDKLNYLFPNDSFNTMFIDNLYDNDTYNICYDIQSYIDICIDKYYSKNESKIDRMQNNLYYLIDNVSFSDEHHYLKKEISVNKNYLDRIASEKAKEKVLS